MAEPPPSSPTREAELRVRTRRAYIGVFVVQVLTLVLLGLLQMCYGH